MAGAVAIVLGFCAEKKSVEASRCADGVDGVGSPCEHFVYISLVRYVKEKLVIRAIENAVYSERELNNT